VDPHEQLLIDLVSDERVSVASFEARFAAALAKSDVLADDNTTATAKLTRERTTTEEARLNGAHACLAAASSNRAAFSAGRFGVSTAVAKSAVGSSKPKGSQDLLEERKKKLAAEGLFDAERKKPLPFLPAVIGVVTSPTGAVIRDILHRVRERFPVHVIIWPSLEAIRPRLLV
jgi:hypothetical protein